MNIKLIGKFFVTLLMAQIIVGSAVTVNAAEVNKGEEEAIERIAKQLEYVYDHSTYDENGNIIDMDIDSISEKYGDYDTLFKVQGIIQAQNKQNEMDKTDGSLISTFSWTGCMKDNLLDLVGFTAFQALIRGGITGLLEKKAWQAAAKLIVRYVGDSLGVGIIAAQLAWYSARCVGK